ncbi:transcription factor E4F1 isoform X1 [Stegostoma tigrinum]|uniref:transcription factor E4F1 isoform X1 n=1 Tax=Stegostoma tigrinum TaxID=3053191 RepID=UPI00202B6DFE|nr:transcription factor E4F1 isoform X1 [Stegostoma tigrinum]
MNSENTAERQSVVAPSGVGEEEEHDVHKCGRCQTEFCNLETFITHKLQKTCQRIQALSTGDSDHLPVNQTTPKESVSLDSAITLTQLVVASLSQPETNNKSQSDDGSNKTCQISEEQLRDYPQSHQSEQSTSDGIDGHSNQKGMEEEIGAEKKKYEIILTDEGRFICQVCEKTFKTAVILKAHMVTHSDKKAFKCKICGMAFRTKGSLVRHNRRHTDERPYKCRMCGMSFRESGALTRHMKAITPCTEKAKFQQMKLVSAPYQEEPEPVNKTETQEVNKQIEELVSTAASNSPETTAVISVLANSEGNFEELQVHNVSQTLDPEVEQKPESLTSTELPPAGETGNENLICQAMRNSGIVIETVTIGDTQKSEEASPLTVEEGLGEDVIEDCCNEIEEDDTTNPKSENSCKNFQCPHCGRVFRGSSYLRLHIKAHLGYKPHRCELCEKEFMTAYILRKHLESHYNERRFKCGECGKLYKSIAHVKEHMRAHSDDRPYSCPKCGKRYKTKNAQQVHLRTHSEDKPFACDYCTRAFREKGSLIRHVRLHTGEKPFTCYKCGRGFAEHGTLNRHLRAKGGCHVGCKELEQQISTDTQATDNVAATIITDDPHTVLVEFSSVVANTQEYIIEAPAEVAGSSDVGTLIQSSKHQVDSQIMKVVQQIVNQANSGHQIIVQNVSMEDNHEEVADTITIATPDSLTEQVAMTLASSIEEGEALMTGSSLETSHNTVTMVAADGIEMLEHTDEYMIATQDGDVEIQTVVVGE